MPLWEVFGHVNELLLGPTAVQPSISVEQLENTVLHPGEWSVFVFVLPFENVTLREVLNRVDEEALLNKEITRVLLGDADEERDDIGD